MYKTLLKIFLFCFPVAIITAWSGDATAYYISGVVEFSYTDYETKVGDSHTSMQYWSQSYRANLNSYLFDPRVVKFRAGVGYTVNTGITNYQDTNNITYDLFALIFPGMKINGEVYAVKNTGRVNGDATSMGYDTETTSYGGTFLFNLSQLRGGAGNRNNNNSDNNNGSRGGRYPVLPDVRLSHVHTEADYTYFNGRTHQSLDNSQASLYYRPVTFADFNLYAVKEQFKDSSSNSSYDSESFGFGSSIAVSPDAKLDLRGKLDDRTTQNIAGYDDLDRTTEYNATLSFKEKKGLSHSYSYTFKDEITTNVDYRTEIADAGVTYRQSDTVSLFGTANQTRSDYLQKATPVMTEQRNIMESISVQAGMTYRKTYTPAYWDLFALDTSYGLTYGSSRYSASSNNQFASDNQSSGSGMYYINAVGLGLHSIKWQKENLSLQYTYNNRRDSSSLHNNSDQQNASIYFSSRRFSRTTINASASYTEQQNSSQFATPLLASETRLRSETTTYNLGVTYTATENLGLDAGATRGESRSKTETISTLPQPTIQNSYIEETAYAGASYHRSIARNLQYRANARDELRQYSSGHEENYLVDMYLDYRIRQVYVNVSAQWRETVPSVGLRTQQQYYFVKLSRPF